MKLKRRAFIGGTTAAAATLAAPPTVAHAARKRWRMALAVPKTLPIWGEGMIRFAKQVETLTGGSIKIRVYGAAELIPALSTFESVANGEIQLGHSASYYWQGKVPSSPFFCAIPFGMSTDDMISWLNAAGGKELWDKVMLPHGVRSFPCGATGFQATGWFNKELKTVNDLKGLKVRVPGLAGKVYSKAGAKPVLLPGGEVFTALSTGVVDAVEWVGPYHDYILGLHKAASYFYTTSWGEPGAILELMCNEKAWQSLTESEKAAIEHACSETTLWMLAQWNTKNAEYLERIKQEGKTTIAKLPKEIEKRLRTLSSEVVAELSKSDPLTKEIYDSYTKFQHQYGRARELAQWSEI